MFSKEASPRGPASTLQRREKTSGAQLFLRAQKRQRTRRGHHFAVARGGDRFGGGNDFRFDLLARLGVAVAGALDVPRDENVAEFVRERRARVKLADMLDRAGA